MELSDIADFLAGIADLDDADDVELSPEFTADDPQPKAKAKAKAAPATAPEEDNGEEFEPLDGAEPVPVVNGPPAPDSAQASTSRGPRWNKHRAVAQACTSWSTSMVDVHAEILKAQGSHMDLEQAFNKLGAAAQSVFAKTKQSIRTWWRSSVFGLQKTTSVARTKVPRTMRL